MRLRNACLFALAACAMMVTPAMATSPPIHAAFNPSEPSDSYPSNLNLGGATFIVVLRDFEPATNSPVFVGRENTNHSIDLGAGNSTGLAIASAPRTIDPG